MRFHPASRVRALVLPLLAAVGLAVAAPADFTDDFSGPNRGWHVQDAARKDVAGISLMTGGEYQMSPVADDTLGFSPAPFRTSSDDVQLGAKVWMYAGVGGGAAGVACRFTDARHFYAFLVTGNGGWVIVKGTPRKLERLASGTVKVRAPMPGLVDVRVEAQCVGDALRMRINGVDAGSARDGEYKGGSNGLAVLAEKAAGASARFDDFALTQFR